MRIAIFLAVVMVVGLVGVRVLANAKVIAEKAHEHRLSQY